MDSDAEEFVTAAHRGDVAVLSEALECCASSEERMNLANAANADGTTALYLASQMGHDDAVLLLLDNGAALDKGRASTGSTPLFVACQHGHGDVVDTLIGRGAILDRPRQDNGATPLFIAACFGRLEVVESLLDQGVDVFAETKDPPGVTAESIAREQRHSTIAELLRVYGQANVKKHGRETAT